MNTEKAINKETKDKIDQLKIKLGPSQMTAPQKAAAEAAIAKASD